MIRQPVLFIIDTLEVGGTEKSLLAITSRMRRVEPIVVHLFNGRTLKPQFEEQGIEVISLNIKSPRNALTCVRKIRNLLNTRRPAAVVAQLYWSEFYSRLACIGLPVKLVGTFVNDSYATARFDRLPWSTKAKLAVYQFADRITARRCDSFLAVSDTIKHSNARALDIDVKKILTIHRGRDASAFPNQARAQATTARFVNVSRLIERKGHVELIRAFHRLITAFPEATLAIAGDGVMKGELEGLIRSLNLERSVTLLGAVKDVPSLLGTSDFFIFPSHYEGFSGALVEAMMSGIPLAASDIEMTREAMTHLKEGYLFSSGDENAVYESMVWLLTHRDQALVMGTRARDAAFRRFDVDVIALQTEDYLLKLIG